MKRILSVVALVVLFSQQSAVTKTINMPSADIAEVIAAARKYLEARHIDLSHRFLASVEYKNLHNEYERPYWLLTWALLAGTSRGRLFVRVSNTGEITVSCDDPRSCPPGV
jgi:hypothetical protein